MKQEKFDDFIANRYESQRKWYSDTAGNNKKKFQSIQLRIIIISAVLPVFSFNEWIYTKYITTLLAIIIAISSALLTTYKYQEHWLNYRTTSELMKKEKVYFDTLTKHYTDVEDPQKLFVESIESLVSVENRQWKTTEETTN